MQCYRESRPAVVGEWQYDAVTDRTCEESRNECVPLPRVGVRTWTNAGQRARRRAGCEPEGEARDASGRHGV